MPYRRAVAVYITVAALCCAFAAWAAHGAGAGASAAGHHQNRGGKKGRESPFLRDVRTRPQTLAMIALLVGVWAWMRKRGWGWPEAGCSYAAVVQRREYWRVMMLADSFCGSIESARHIS